MNKPLRVLAAVLVSVCAAMPALAAPTQFKSDNYGVESVIFGGTGVLRSSQASTPPSILGSPQVSAITTSSATIGWKTDKPSNGVVVMGTVSGTYPIQAGTIVDTTQTTHSVSLSLLTRGTTYYYRVRSNDVSGNLVESTEQTFVTDPGDITPPGVTSGPDLAINSATSVTVTWQTDELANTGVEYGLNSVTENTAGQPDERTLFHQVVIANLLPSQKYILRIKSRDVSDNLYTGAILNLTTLSSPAISEVKISDITLNSAVIQWHTTSTSNSFIDYGNSSSYGQQFADAGTYTQTHIARLSGLESGTVYRLRISGLDQSAQPNLLRSDEYVFRTIVLPKITDFKISDVGSNGGTLTWKSSAETNEFITYSAVSGADKSALGKIENRANAKLASDHTFQLADLESSTEYAVTVFGNDVFGNQSPPVTLDFTTKIDTTPPLIESLKSSTTEDLGSQQTVQVLVSLGLNELGTVVLEYGDGASGSYDKRVATEIEPTRTHFLVIPGLEPGNSYHFRAVAKDLAGNEADSADYLVLAPSKPVSLLDLIFAQLRDNFAPLFQLGGS